MCLKIMLYILKLVFPQMYQSNLDLNSVELFDAEK